MEIYLHDLFDVGRNPMFYNKAKQTTTGFDRTGTLPWNTGKEHPDETKHKIAEKAKLRIGEKNPFYGRVHSKNSAEKISLAKRGPDKPFLDTELIYKMWEERGGKHGVLSELGRIFQCRHSVISNHIKKFNRLNKGK